MANNIGVTNLKLSRVIGGLTSYDASSNVSSVTMVSGDLDLGCMIFDDDGTLGICTNLSRDDNNNPIYTIRTSSLNTEIDIQSMLSNNY